MIEVYQFAVFNIIEGVEELSKHKATKAAIAAIDGARRLNETRELVDQALVDENGFFYS